MESNVERNRKILGEFKKIPDGDGWLEGMFALGARNTLLLIDISKSLARIADALESDGNDTKRTIQDNR